MAGIVPTSEVCTLAVVLLPIVVNEIVRGGVAPSDVKFLTDISELG